MVGSALIPRAAVLDPEVTDYMPGRLVAGTGFDALSHAIEAFLSRRATRISDLFAREAARLILESLADAVRGSREAREVMLRSWRRGVAVITCGVSTLRIAPPLIITDELVDVGMEIIEDVIREVDREYRK